IIVLFTVMNLGGEHLPAVLIVSGANSIILVVIFYRVGTFSLASAIFTAYFAFYLFSWSDPRALLALCLLLGLGLITFYLSLGGKPVFGTLPLDDDIGLET
ncbi:MAG TPA: hypothetical protein VMS56_02675, partial [Thermoanaerobaculia bacterium]|nr:hypothetical protein [Thermoanaerobaculia bacterium]